MKLCYNCFLKYYSNLELASKLWDKLWTNLEVKKTCNHCGLTGIYVRAITK